jgi:hypothetical protein
MNYYERYDKYPSRIEGILLENFGVLENAPEITDGSIISGKVIEEDGDKILTAELRVDTADDLPAYDSIEGYILRDCIALVVHTGDIWAQDSAGEWYNQTSPAAPNATLNASSASLTKTDILKSEPTADILGKADTETETNPETPEDESLRSDEDDIDV